MLYSARMMSIAPGREGRQELRIDPSKSPPVSGHGKAIQIHRHFGRLSPTQGARVGARSVTEAALHHGIELALGGQRHRIDLCEQSGRSITVYAQHEVIKDMVAARIAADRQIVFSVSEVSIHSTDTDRPSLRYTSEARYAGSTPISSRQQSRTDRRHTFRSCNCIKCEE